VYGKTSDLSSKVSAHSRLPLLLFEAIPRRPHAITDLVSAYRWTIASWPRYAMQCCDPVASMGPRWQLHMAHRPVDEVYIKAGIFHMFLYLLHHHTTIALPIQSISLVPEIS
jgi:hypothetical protein